MRVATGTERYLAVSRMDLPTKLDAERLKTQVEARAEAARLRDALQPRIPTLIVKIDGATDATVTVDDQPLPAELLGVKRSIDPGQHTIVGRAGDEVVTRQLMLKESESQTAELTFHNAVAAPLPPKPTAPAVLSSSPAADATPTPQRTIGFVGIGVGAAGIAVGALFGGLALSEHGNLVTQCGAQLQCGSQNEDAANSYNSKRIISGVAFIGGAALAATGLALVLTSPSSKRTAAVTLGPGTAGVAAKF